MSKSLGKIGWITAAALVVSNMIGTGVFTSLGFQVVELNNTYTLISIWIIGGILALFGAFCYAELGTQFHENGGDYLYLSRTFHPLLGYLSSWISLVIGFSSPVSLAALAMVSYLNFLNIQYEKTFAISIIILVAIMLSFSLKISSKFHNLFTLIKIIFIIFLIILGFYIAPEKQNLILDSSWKAEIFLPTFASSLVFVTYAYTGWNSASYIAGEIKNPSKNIPKALIIGTLFVTLCYVFINFIILKHASIPELYKKEDVMGIASKNMLGFSGYKWINLFIAIQLISTISGYLWIGSRITQATAKRHKLWFPLSKTNKNGIPIRSIWIHTIISILIILSGSFKEIFIYTAFLLQLLATLAVSTVFFIKKEKRNLFKSNLFFIFPIIFELFGLYILFFTFKNNQKESILGLCILLIGIILYFLDKNKKVT